MKTKFLPALSMLLLVVLSVSSFSCGDDDDAVDCNSLYAQIGVATGDLLNADCEVRIAAYTKLISLYNQGKDCQALKDAVVDEGYASVAEFIVELEANKAEEEDDC